MIQAIRKNNTPTDPNMIASRIDWLLQMIVKANHNVSVMRVPTFVTECNKPADSTSDCDWDGRKEENQDLDGVS